MVLVTCLKDEQFLSQYLAFVWELDDWFDRNVEKTEDMDIGRAQRGIDGTTPLSIPIQIKRQQVLRAYSFKYLGTVINRRLSFSDHVDQVYRGQAKTGPFEETPQLQCQN